MGSSLYNLTTYCFLLIYFSLLNLLKASLAIKYIKMLL